MTYSISTHIKDALKRLITQYKNTSHIKWIIEAYGDQIQELEYVFRDLINERSIVSSHAKQLDGIGDILGEARKHLDDDAYRIVLISKIAKNISEGTPEDMIAIFKLLSQSEFVQYGEIYPGSITLNGINTNFIINPKHLRLSLGAAKPIGVAIDSMVMTNDTPFVFEGDPFQNGKGFGDVYNESVGGHLAKAI